MENELASYLNDHLAGSSGALLLIQQLTDSHDAPEAQELFLQLKSQIAADRALLIDLLERIGQSPGTFSNVAGVIAARIGGIKLTWDQIQPGKVGLFEALEMLALVVQGKRLLWMALRETIPWFPEWNDIDFAVLEMQAMQQRDEIEFWRIKAAVDILADAQHRIGDPT